LDAKQKIIMSIWDEWSEELDLDIGNPRLVESLKKANHIKPRRRLSLSDEEQVNVFNRNKLKATFDHDRGAFQMWAWAAEGKNSDQLIFDGTFRPLREMGYVMWDMETVEQIDLQASMTRVMVYVRHPYPTRGELEDMFDSFNLREAVFIRGGRGYWAGDMESIR
jgi:hypothetical protein